MKIHSYALLASLAVLTFSACKKEDKISKTELLTSGSWKVSSQVTTKGSSSTDDYKEMKDCEKDDYITFKTNGSVEYNAGTIKCWEDEDQVETSEWKFSENETTLIIDGLQSTILALTKSDLKVSVTYPLDAGTATTVVTFIH